MATYRLPSGTIFPGSGKLPAQAFKRDAAAKSAAALTRLSVRPAFNFTATTSLPWVKASPLKNANQIFNEWASAP